MFPEHSTIFQSSPPTTSSNKNLQSQIRSPPSIPPSYSQIFPKSSQTSSLIPPQMPSETDFPDQFSPSLAETLRNSLILSSIFGGANSPPETHDRTGGESIERIVFINALTRTMVVVESDGGSFDDLIEKSGRRPASKASIDALPSVEGGDEQCAVCLEGWEGGETAAKEMPCKHRFHGGCIERWLNVNGSCPVCRYQMPEAEAEEDKNRESMRGIWMSFDFGGDRRSWEDDRSVGDEHRESSDSSQNRRATED